MESLGEITVLNQITNKLETYNVHTGELLANGRDSFLTEFTSYSPQLAFAIASLVREGRTLKEIVAMPNMPSLHRIYAWQSLYPDFKKMMEDARSDRADYYHDSLLAETDKKELTESQYRALRMRADTLKWAAEKGNGARYGSQKTAAGVSGPLQIIVNTGIIRGEPDPITVTVTSVEKTDEK